MPREVSVVRHVRQSMHLTGFLHACFRDDAAQVGRHMVDLIAEDARAPLIPGFKDARGAALAAGALSLSIAGSGPTVFAWVEDHEVAHSVESAIRWTFQQQGIACDAWSGPVNRTGAHLCR